MNTIKMYVVMILATFGMLACTMSPAIAKVNLFTDHQVIYMVQHGVNQNQDVQFPTGKYPYLGRAGIEYELRRLTYSLSYIHRSNVDISGGDEYNYNGISLGLKYTHCVVDC